MCQMNMFPVVTSQVTQHDYS